MMSFVQIDSAYLGKKLGLGTDHGSLHMALVVGSGRTALALLFTFSVSLGEIGTVGKSPCFL